MFLHSVAVALSVLVLLVSSALGAQTCTLNSDTTVRNAPGLAKPAYLASVNDPAYGTKITRITGDPGASIEGISGGVWGNVARHHYSKDQAWNADQTLIFIDRNEDGGQPAPLFLDGETYKPLFSRGIPGEARWHPTDPNLMISVSGSTLSTVNVRTGAKTVIKQFSGYSGLQLGPYEGNLSADGKLIALVGKNRNGARVVLVYDMAAAAMRAEIRLSSLTSSIDWASVSASGQYVVVNTGTDRTIVLNYDGSVVTRFNEYGRPSHYDLTLNAAGEDIAVGVSKSRPDEGKVVVRRLRDGAVTALTTAGYATHSSARNLKRPGFAFSDFEAQSPARLYSGEITTYSLAGGTVYRIAHHRNIITDYLTESHSSPSPTGDRVIFVSNWGASSGRPVQAYVADFRGLCREPT